MVKKSWEWKWANWDTDIMTKVYLRNKITFRTKITHFWLVIIFVRSINNLETNSCTVTALAGKKDYETIYTHYLVVFWTLTVFSLVDITGLVFFTSTPFRHEFPASLLKFSKPSEVKPSLVWKLPQMSIDTGYSMYNEPKFFTLSLQGFLF